MVILKVLGYLCYAFGIADFALSWFGTDLTGVRWSPIVAFVLGTILVRVGSSSEE